MKHILRVLPDVVIIFPPVVGVMAEETWGDQKRNHGETISRSTIIVPST